MARKPSQQVGAESAARLRDWIEHTPLCDVPLNHNGLSSKVAICNTLGITKSTIATNAHLREIFDELDRSLSSFPAGLRSSSPVLSGVDQSPQQLVDLLGELDKVHAELARMSYLSLTGRWIS